ncbi:MAG: hypothetical protein AB7J46_04770 [Candidatus Altimarinota bacterium]
MKKHDIWREMIGVAAVLLALVLFFNPFDLWELSIELKKSIVLGVITFFVFAFITCHHRKNDERENFVLYSAERTAFVSGSMLAIIGLLYQMITTGELDHWLVATFLVMTIAKGIGLMYAKIKH